jgi:hypothetical protein
MRKNAFSLKVALLTVPLLFCPDVWAEAMWVWGSWVNVRESADAQSMVIDYVTTNTKVETEAREGGMCAIEWGTAEAKKHGFVACRLLGKRPLTLEETADDVDGGLQSRATLERTLSSNPKYSPPRAFWISPSMRALLNAGEYFERTLLSSKQDELEQGFFEETEPPPIVRYPIPEFEAMKALLENGIVAGISEDPPLLSCTQVPRKMIFATFEKWLQNLYSNGSSMPFYNDSATVIHNGFPTAIYYCFLPKNPVLNLPEIRSSFFKDKNILPGDARIEQISAHFGITERLRVTGGPYWAQSRHNPIWLIGAWDIGFYDLTLTQPVFEHVINSDGQIGVYEWTPKVSYHDRYIMKPFSPEPGPGNFAGKEKLSAYYYYTECKEGGFVNQRRASKHIAGSPVKDALLWFQSPVTLLLQKARVVTKKPHEDITVHEVDLDHDGIFDFVHWHFEDKTHDTKYRAVFINIDGVWYPFEQDYYENCAD